MYLPKQQTRIRRRCGHANSGFRKFDKSEIEQSIAARFEARVLEYPDRAAIVTEAEDVTYKRLNRSANAVARAILSRLGDGQHVVALLFEQGLPSITATLGALKAGKVYAPLDPRAPQTMLSALIKELQPDLVLAGGGHLGTAEDVASAGIALLDIAEVDPVRVDENPSTRSTPDSYAYVYYTSGSTSRPKGVVDTHRNVLHNVMRYTNTLHIGPRDRLTLLHSPNSSATVSSLFGALLNGAAVCPMDLHPDRITRLEDWLRDREITIYHSVPAVFRRWADKSGKLPKLRLIRLEGDQTTATDVELYRKHFGDDCILVNGLGATECGIVRQFFIDKRTATEGTVPVGYSVEDMDVFVVDGQGRPAGTGVVGEIAVRSHHLSPGYWRAAETTRAAIALNPDRRHQTVYRTGDLGRMRPDGCLVHLGRRDSRVKIRGHAVELADVEVALLDLNGIQEAVVIREQRNDSDRLVAYLVTAASPATTPSSLRRSLEDRLPEYMIPSAFVMLPSLPLTAAGKIDRGALPAPGRARPQIDVKYEPPRSPVQAELARIWREVLDLEGIGIHDPFLDLGGDSLLAVQIVSRVTRSFQLELDLRALFDTPTIADMARLVIEHLASRMNPASLGHLLDKLETPSGREGPPSIEGEAGCES